VSIQTPNSRRTALRAAARSGARTFGLIARRTLHQPPHRIGLTLRFGDGTSAQVYRETVIDRAPAIEPCVLVVRFRLRGVRGIGHPLFRWVSELNTPLFAGSDGLVRKLWLQHDQHRYYRGVYDWDGVAAAENYARSLWPVLALVSVHGSIGYHVVRGASIETAIHDGLSIGDHWWTIAPPTHSAQRSCQNGGIHQ
jgi:hypothetical protein